MTFKLVGVKAGKPAVQRGRDGGMELEGLHQLDGIGRPSASNSEVDPVQPREILHQQSSFR